MYKKDVERISEMCSKFRKWIHKKRSKIKGRLKQDPNNKCTVCKNKKLMGGNTEDKLLIIVKENNMVDCVDNL